jgi:hypothetical protein
LSATDFFKRISLKMGICSVKSNKSKEIFLIKQQIYLSTHPHHIEESRETATANKTAAANKGNYTKYKIIYSLGERAARSRL